MKCDCPKDCKCEEPDNEVPGIAIPLPSGPYLLGRRFRREEDITNDLIIWDWFQRMNRRILCRWLIILIYLMVFYLVVFLFFTTVLFAFLYMLPNNRPVSGPNMPGLSYSPSPLYRTTNAITYKKNDYQDIKPYILKIDEFLDKYGKAGRERFLNCDLDGSYGYTKHEPCIFIKLNRVLNYIPATYNEAVSLPTMAPDELYSDMLARVTGTYDNRVWLSCTVIKPLLDVKINYVPERFYEAEALEHPPKNAHDSYDREGYNYTGSSGFRRIIGIKLFNLPIGQMVTIKCTVWAKNIPIDYYNQGQGILYIRMIVQHHELSWVGEGLHAKLD